MGDTLGLAEWESGSSAGLMSLLGCLTHTAVSGMRLLVLTSVYIVRGLVQPG